MNEISKEYIKNKRIDDITSKYDEIREYTEYIAANLNYAICYSEMACLKLGLPTFEEFKKWKEVVNKWNSLKNSMTKEEFLDFLDRMKKNELNEKDLELLKNK